MIPDITICNHCWGYSRLLALQMSGLVVYRPTCRVEYVLCATAEDRQTIDTFTWYEPKLPQTVSARLHVMNKRHVVRREIGRNEIAKSTKSPIVWFCDTDYVVGPVELEGFLSHIPAGCKLSHPSHVHATTHPRGMELIQAIDVDSLRVFEFNLTADFPLTQRMSVAIGGLQFVSGDWCRKHGYCGDEVGGRRLGPADRWQGTKGDRKIRFKIGEDQRIKGVFFNRVRHSVRSEGHKEDAKL